MKYNINGDIHPFEASTLDGTCVYCGKTAQEHVGHEVGEPTFCGGCDWRNRRCRCAEREGHKTIFELDPDGAQERDRRFMQEVHNRADDKIVSMSAYCERKQREQVAADIVDWECPVCGEINCFDKSLSTVDPCGACGCPCGDVL